MNFPIKLKKDAPLIFLLLVMLTYMVLLPLEGYGQDLKNINFSHITAGDGLSHHEVLFVFQDTQGFMWFGTKHGLNKYDGMSVTQFFQNPEIESSGSLVGNFAHWIHEDQNNGLWIATWGGGISRYDLKFDTFTNYYHEGDPNSLASNNVWSLFVDREGLVWAATDGGVSKYNPETKTFVTYRHNKQNPNSLSNNVVSRIRQDDMGIFWISTYGGGLDRFDPKTETFTNYKHQDENPRSISHNNLWGVYIDSKKRIWVASEDGLDRFDPKTEVFTHYRHAETNPNSPSSNIITFIHEDKSGMLWLGTFGGGVNRFDPEQETFTHYQHDPQNPHSLSNDIVMSIYEDITGTLWIATYGGVDKYDPGENQFGHYYNNPVIAHDLNESKVRSIYQDNNGLVWIGTGGGGLNSFDRTDDDHFENYQHDENDPTSISGNDVWAISEDMRGDFWIGTHEKGLNRFNPSHQTFTRYQHDPHNSNTLASNSVYDLVVDQNRNVLWIASYLSGLDKFDIEKETFTHYRYDDDNPDGVVSNWATAVFVDSSGLVWVGTEAGLSRFNPQTSQFTNFKYERTNPESLSSSMVQTIFEDSDNIVWIGTSNGLNKYKQGAGFKRFYKKDGLAGDYIAAILEDRRGHLWISTNKGLSDFNPQDETFKNYNRHDGLQGDRFLMHSACTSKGGELLFGGENGFNVFNPDEIVDNQHIPEVVFTNFKVFNQPVDVGENSPLRHHINQAKKILLEHDQSVFSLEFVALNFRNSKNNKYAYMLEGFDEGYTYVDSDHRTVTYTNLDAGQYSFHVKASNNSGIWNERSKSIEIVITPPWWETFWFRGALFILGAGVVLGVFRFRLHSVQQSRRRLEAQVAQQARELEVVESLRQYKQIVSNSTDMIALMDKQYNYITVNEMYAGAFNLSPERLIGNRVIDIVGEEFFHSIIKPRSDRCLSGEYINYQDWFDFPVYGRCYMDVSYFPYYDEQNKIQGYAVNSRNITERKQAEESLRESEEEFRDLFENTPVSSWLEDFSGVKKYFDALREEGISDIETYFQEHPEELEKCVQHVKIKDVNQKTLNLHQAKSKDQLLQGLEKTFTPESLVAFKKEMIDMWHGKTQATYDDATVQTFNDEVRYVTVSYKVAPGHEESLDQVLVTLVDITEKTLADKQKNKLEMQLQQAQKMEAIGTLAGGIAHDFNNILAAIIGYAEMARDDSPPGSTVAQDLDKVLEGGNRAKNLVQQILAFSRQNETERIPLQPANVVKEAIKILRPSLPTTIEINQDITSTNDLVLADPTQIHQILMNLCTNAFHAMEETGGNLGISLNEVTLSTEDLVHEADVEAGNFVQLSISDSGSGIPPEIMKNIFDPYFTTKETGKGTGMGLAIVHGIVKSYRGFISLYSEPGEGTAFHVFIPVIEKELLPEVEDAKPTPVGEERILLIDDEEILAEMGKSMLERLGYRVTLRNNSIEALETFQNQPDQFDLVITDQTMPGMTGADIARRMIQTRPDIPIILCTGYSTVISEEKAKSFGIKEFALKPLSKKDIAVLIRKVLDHS